MPTLNLVSSIQAYADSIQTASPLMQLLNWTKKLLNVSVTRPSSQQFFVDPDQTLTVFDGQRATSIAGDTEMDVTLSPLSSSRYRISAVAGTSPAYRTARTLIVSGIELTITTIANGTIQVVADTVDTFENVVAGDQIWIPGESTGDSAGPFDASNEGLWSVLSVAPVDGDADRMLTLRRLDDSDATGATEVVTPASNSEFIAFSATGVQPGDNVEFASLNWTQGLRKVFSVDRVTPSWFEILSTEPLPLDVGVLPTNSGLVFYTDVKRYVRIEVDQEASVRFNGDAGSSVRVSPLAPADANATGWIEKFGPTWTLAVVNRTPYRLTLTVMAAE